MAQTTRHCAYGNHGQVPTYKFYRNRHTNRITGYCKDCSKEYRHLHYFGSLVGRPKKDGTRAFPDWYRDVILAHGRPITLTMTATLVNGEPFVQHSGRLEMSTNVFAEKFVANG